MFLSCGAGVAVRPGVRVGPRAGVAQFVRVAARRAGVAGEEDRHRTHRLAGRGPAGTRRPSPVVWPLVRRSGRVRPGHGGWTVVTRRGSLGEYGATVPDRAGRRKQNG